MERAVRMIPVVGAGRPASFPFGPRGRPSESNKVYRRREPSYPERACCCRNIGCHSP